MKSLGFDLVLLGAPASGKDTQALMLKKKFSFRSVESGKHWRKMQRGKGVVAARIKKTSGKGLWTPTDLMRSFLKKEMSKPNYGKDILFIGNPRMPSEARLLNQLMHKIRHDYLVLYITLPVREIIKRSVKRNRDIQDVKYVQSRIRYHKEYVAKTVGYFKKQGKLININGNQSRGRVYSDLTRALNDYSRQKNNRNP